jgi:hypothetical protein
METGRSTRAGGCLFSLALLAGVGLGAHYGQPSIGFLGGTGVGLVVLILAWLIDRSRVS